MIMPWPDLEKHNSKNIDQLDQNEKHARKATKTPDVLRVVLRPTSAPENLLHIQNVNVVEGALFRLVDFRAVG